MKKLTTSESLVTINHFKNVLESEGIPCRIKNEFLGGIAGEMPLTETWPELWVMSDIDFDRARQLIDEAIVDESLRRYRDDREKDALGSRRRPPAAVASF